MSLKSAIESAKAKVVAAYAAISAKGGTLPTTQNLANLPQAIADLPSGGSDNYAEALDGTPIGFIAAYGANNKRVIVDNISTTIASKIFVSSNVKGCERLEIGNVTYLPNQAFYTCQAKRIYLPNVETAGTIMFFGATELRVLYIPKMVITGSMDRFFGDTTTKLIDLSICWGANVNVDMSRCDWSPTEAMLDDSTSLLTEEDIAAGYTSNRQKFLYNIREHIAYKLADRSGQSRLTFKVPTAINDILDDETRNAFDSMGWNVGA